MVIDNLLGPLPIFVEILIHRVDLLQFDRTSQPAVASLAFVATIGGKTSFGQNCFDFLQNCDQVGCLSFAIDKSRT